MTDQRLLGVYLNNHLTGANGGVDLFRRAAEQHRGTDVGDELAQLAEEVREDRAALRRVMRRLGVEENRPMTLLGKVGERVGRFKPNGFVVRRSPLSDVVELEALRVAVAGRTAGWQLLLVVAGDDAQLDRDEVEGRVRLAEEHAARLARLHLSMAEEQLAR